MGALKKIPKWGWVAGGLGLAIFALVLYEHYQNKEEVLDPCDPSNPDYDPALCEAPADTAQYPAKQMTMPSGAAGGTQYYLPFPGESDRAPAKGAEDGLPEEVAEELPAEEVITPPSTPGMIVTPTLPGQPVPGSSPSEGLYGAIPAPAPAPFQHAPPVPSPSPPPIAIAPSQPAPSGWCGHPNAVGVGQPCSYKDSHSPPSGWHWFCCNGALGRAPN